MAVMSRINRKANTNAETGLSTSTASTGGRFFNHDGSPNLKITGISYMQRFSIFRTLLNLSSLQFFLVLFTGYFIMNLAFATIYLLTGIDGLGGLHERTIMGKFWEAFFFSAQTITTVGYGHVFPNNLATSLVAGLEAFIGLLMLALATGLIYGRFSQPRPYIMYSDIAVIGPYNGGLALMLRFAPYKEHYLTDVEVKLTLGMRVSENGVDKNQFYGLKLQLSKANTLTMNWTIVHPIDEDSPLYGLMKQDIEEAESEVLVFVKGYDEGYANNVVSRTSYAYTDFVYGAKFKMMYKQSEDRSHTIMDLSKINDHEMVDLAVNM